ncbi:Neuropeptide FF receptor 2 [Trichoplax sp. H2]|nr:Neuropeptide FF receptor 2 [Trichoplax sp. H2]|eukprot:RDD39014.1 Neuropeptide FF receptor 2 [Trichoplax sp. H2]
MDNLTNIDHARDHTSENKFFYYLLPLVVLSLILNSISCFAIIRCNDLHKMLFVLIFNLALGDVVTAIALSFHSGISLFVLKPNWTAFNVDTYCRISGVTIVGGITVGIYTLAAISIERFRIMVLRKKDNNLARKKWNLIIMIFSLWTLSFGLSFPYLYLFRMYPREPCRCELYSFNIQQFRYYLIIYSIIVYLLPLIMIITAYIRIWMYITRFTIANLIISNNSIALSVRNRRKHIFKMLIVSTMTFMIFTAVVIYVPTMLAARDKITTENKGTGLFMIRLGIILYLISTIINPLIYNYYCSAFRQAYFMYLPSWNCCTNPMSPKIMYYFHRLRKPAVCD